MLLQKKIKLVIKCDMFLWCFPNMLLKAGFMLDLNVLSFPQ